MPLLDLQQRTREIGRIRIGQQVDFRRQDGSTGRRPVKLDTFRFTTNDPSAAERIAEHFGGEKRPWVNGTQAFEVVTEATTLGVMVPAGEAALSQWYELWSGGGVQRRCDGETEQLRQAPCQCPKEIADRMDAAGRGQACKPTTRVNVILPDLPGLGVWRYESHGYTAALELGGTAELLSRAREAGVTIAAKMRIEPRQSTKGGETRKWMVVVLDVEATLRELLTGGGPQTLADALPPAPSGAKAIEGPKTSAAPEPDERRPRGPSGAAEQAPPVETASEAGSPPDDDDGPASTGGQESQRRRPGKAVSAGIPKSAQGIVDEARTCTDVARLTELALATQRHGWGDVMVEDADGVLEPLWDALTSRKAALDAAEGAA